MGWKNGSTWSKLWYLRFMYMVFTYKVGIFSYSLQDSIFDQFWRKSGYLLLLCFIRNVYNEQYLQGVEILKKKWWIQPLDFNQIRNLFWLVGRESGLIRPLRGWHYKVLFSRFLIGLRLSAYQSKKITAVFPYNIVKDKFFLNLHTGEKYFFPEHIGILRE